MKVQNTATYSLVKSMLNQKALEAISFDSDDTNRLISALDNAYVNKSSISLPYWADQLGTTFIETFSFIMSTFSLLDIEIRNKYASLSISNLAMIKHLGFANVISYRKTVKLAKYMPTYVNEVQPANLTKAPSGIKDNGLVRRGFAKSANVAFTYDIAKLIKYYDAILLNTTKSMRKLVKKYSHIMEDSSGYAVISELVINEIIANPEAKYNLERNVSDQRGRAIYGGLKRVFNPIGYKDARALISFVNGQVLTVKDRYALDNIYSYIAELNGLKRQRYATKQLAGMVAYKNRTLPILNLLDEDDRKDLHNLIMLERIYSSLDKLFENGEVYWDIPIEIDGTMSLGQIVACITNDKRLMQKTNIIEKDNLQDAWHIDGVRRLSAKAQVATFYGSSQTVTNLLASKNININKDEVRAIRREFSKGAFAVIKALKDATIKTSNVQTPSYSVTAWNETYTVEVNKFHTVASELKPYMVWNPAKNRTKTFFMHHPIKVPDYKRFSLFMTTGLIHNLDSKVADNTCLTVQATDNEVIAIHDAFLILPQVANITRNAYANNLNLLSENRDVILTNYRNSIGAVGRKADKAFKLVQDLTEPLKGKLKAQVSALK